MKKEAVLTLRVDYEVNDVIRALARKEDRSIAWVARKLITEALEARKLLNPKS